jgi:hypothetical protein
VQRGAGGVQGGARQGSRTESTESVRTLLSHPPTHLPKHLHMLMMIKLVEEQTVGVHGVTRRATTDAIADHNSRSFSNSR